MAALEDHSYLKACAELASCLSISLSSARRKVEIAASKAGKKDLLSRKQIADKLLKAAKSEGNKSENSASKLDKLLEALASEENFMTED